VTSEEDRNIIVNLGLKLCVNVLSIAAVLGVFYVYV